MCYVEPFQGIHRVAPNCANVIVLGDVCVQRDLPQQARLLKDIAAGKQGAAPVEFLCGCRIEQYERDGGGKKVLGVRLVRPTGPGCTDTIMLKGHEDLRDFLDGSQQVGGGLYGNLNTDIDHQGISAFLAANRRCYARYVERFAVAAVQGRNVVAAAGAIGPDIGRFKYIPVQQGIAETYAGFCATGIRPARRPALECFGSTFVNALMSLGLVNPTLPRGAFEKRYTYLHGDPVAQDGVSFDQADSGVLRGLESAKNTLVGGHVFTIVHRFQGTDWAKLMGMHRHTIEVVSLAGTSAATVKGYLDEGWEVQLYTPRYVIYDNSAHWVTLRGLNPPPTTGGLWRFSYTENDHYPPSPQMNELGNRSEGERSVQSFDAMGKCVRTFVVK